MISKIKFIIAESFRGFFYAWTPALLSCITIGISLFVITVSFFSYFLFITYADTVTKDYELNVFFETCINVIFAEFQLVATSLQLQLCDFLDLGRFCIQHFLNGQPKNL